jgi:hypothetical protein
MERIDNGVQRDGARYLFALRLVPIVPFFVANLAMGLTQVKPATFAWVSWLGMLPVTILYVNAGSKLAAVRSAGDLVNWPLVSALVAAALFPFAAKGVLAGGRARSMRRGRGQNARTITWSSSARAQQAWRQPISQRPSRPASRSSNGENGRRLLNTGALIRSAKLAVEGRKASVYGLKGRLQPDFAATMERVRTVIERTAPHDSAERCRILGVDVLHGEARITSPWTVDVGGRTLTTRNIVVATGAEPIMPAIPGIDQAEPLTSETVSSLTILPQTLLIVGGGPVGCELAQAFGRFGARVIMVGSAPRLIAREDEVASEAMRALLIAEGVELHLAITVERFERRQGQFLARLKDGSELAFDRVLVGAGRRPRVHGFGLEALGPIPAGWPKIRRRRGSGGARASVQHADLAAALEAAGVRASWRVAGCFCVSSARRNPSISPRFSEFSIQPL